MASKIYLFFILSIVAIIQLILWNSRKAHNYRVAYLQIRLKKIKQEAFDAGVRWGQNKLTAKDPEDIETYFDWITTYVTDEEVENLLSKENIKVSFKRKRRNSLQNEALSFRRW